LLFSSRPSAAASRFGFFVNDPATTEVYTLSLHDALPISAKPAPMRRPMRRIMPVGGSCAAAAGVAEAAPTARPGPGRAGAARPRSEEHTSELQSRENLVCRLLLEKKNKAE